MSKSPSPNGRNGRGPNGRFTMGNRGGPGNPDASRVGRFRGALFETVTVADWKAIIGTLVEAARRGEPWAIRELLERVLGRAVPADLIERLEQLETLVQERCSDAMANRRQQSDKLQVDTFSSDVAHSFRPNP